ncbi:MAG: adenosylmethionine decarboxylase [Candidatus Pacebacteria bacterium]|nr:adenosylmethionine decarboxylase [Candidatus Paceibacterota bacterium]
MKNIIFSNKILGTHHVIDLFGCNRQQINSESFLHKVLVDSLEGTGIELLNQSFYRFDPQGITGFLLLSTSHVSVHSWPEYGYLSLDVYSCSSESSTRAVAEYILSKIVHSSAVVKIIDRSYPIPTESQPDAMLLPIPRYSDGTTVYAHITKRVEDIKSSFQHIEVLDTEEFGRTLVIDGLVQTTEKDHHLYDETILGKLQGSDSEIIILGGGDGYVAQLAIAKNPSLKVTIIDLDIEVVELAKHHLGQTIFSHPNVTLHIGDALQYLKTLEGNLVDGFVIDLTDNPLMSLEDTYTEDYTHFFSHIFVAVKKYLKQGGWVCMQAGASTVEGTYLDTAQVLYELAQHHFSQVERKDVLVPSFGEENCFVFCKNS